MSPPLQTAAQLLRQGQPALAIPFLRAAAAQAPQNPALRHDLGLACLEAGQLPEAIAALRTALALKPKYPDAQLRLGIALDLAGHTQEALAAFRAANTADAHYRAADILENLGRIPEAIAAYRRAAAAAPRTTLGRLAAAATALLAKNDAEAEKKLRQTLFHDKTNPVALERLATLLAEHGRFAEAEPLYAAAAASPSHAGCQYERVRCRRITPDDAPLIAHLNDLAANPALDPIARARLHLALGKAADDLGDPETAYRHFTTGQLLRDSLCRYSAAAFEAEAARMRALQPSRFTAAAQTPPTGPILILGLPRTGTTLLEHMLSAHPAIAAGGELPFWCFHGPSLETESPAALQEAGHAYAAECRRIAAPPRRVTDKMPLNFLYAGPILLACPAALIIHCRRHRLDTALSIQSTWFNPRMPFPTSTAPLAGYMATHARLMAHWRATLPAAHFLEVAYEDLTAAPEPTLRRVLAAAGLPWHAPCLHPETIAGPLRTPSKFQARQPITTASAGRWQRYAGLLAAFGAE